MALANLGSIAARVYGRFDNIPVPVSGELMEMADEERLYMESYTGDNIGSVGIAEKYQPALINLTTAAALGAMKMFGGDFKEAKIGDFTIKKGKDGNIDNAMAYYKERGERKLRIIGKQMRYRRVLS